MPLLIKTLPALFAALAWLAATPACADLVVIVDVSDSGPAMRGAASDQFVRQAAEHIARRIARQPLGARLIAFTAGDHASVDAPLLNVLIQRTRSSSGDKAEAYSRGFVHFLDTKLNERRARPADRQSHLTAAVADARRLMTPGSPCEIHMLTDLAEWNHSGVKYPRDHKKPLPVVPGLSLKGCVVTVYGAGQGQEPRAALAIATHWEHWLQAAGAAPVVLQRF